MTLIFIAGGARSGKSRKGEEIAKSLAGSAKPIFIATAEAVDDEMTSRIKKHQDDRGTAFELVEESKKREFAKPTSAISIKDIMMRRGKVLSE